MQKWVTEKTTGNGILDVLSAKTTDIKFCDYKETDVNYTL